MAMSSFHEMDDPASPSQLKAEAAFLIRHHSDQLRSIALSPDPNLHYPLHIEWVISSINQSINHLYSSHFPLSISMFLSFAELMDDDPPLAQSLFSQPTDHLRLFDDAAIWAHVWTFCFFSSIVHFCPLKFLNFHFECLIPFSYWSISLIIWWHLALYEWHLLIDDPYLALSGHIINRDKLIWPEYGKNGVLFLSRECGLPPVFFFYWRSPFILNIQWQMVVDFNLHILFS